jgi:TetR/AcrR family transcriptional repressor of nem operon
VVERAPADPEVADAVGSALTDVDQAIVDALGVPVELAAGVTAAALGLILRGNADRAGVALARHLDPPH